MTEIKKWSEILSIVSGKNQKAVENPIGKYPIYGSGGVIGRANEYLCESGTTIVGRKGTINNPIFVSERFWNVDTAFGISPGEGLNPKFLYYFCRHFNFKDLDKSTTIPSLAKRDLMAIEMPVPTLGEQERIVARIEELFSQLDSGVETLKTVKRQLTVYRQAVLKNVFDSISNSYDVPILSVCDYIIDCPHSTPKWTRAGKLCLRTTNFRRGYLDLSEKNYVSDETYKKRTSRLTPVPGDVLFSREGAILGIACIIPDDLQACMGQRMMLLRPNEQLNNKYLMYYLNSSRVNQLVVENVGGSASPHINVGDIKKFPILMLPIEMQRQLVSDIEARLSICDSIEKNVDAALQQAEAMHQSILKQAFEGKL